MKGLNSKNLPTKLSHLIEHADWVFSNYVKLKKSKNQRAQCFFCRIEFPITMLDNMHFRKRVHMNTRFEIDNCNPGCRQCHQRFGDDDVVYGARLDMIHGDGFADSLRQKSHVIRKWTHGELNEMIDQWNLEIIKMMR